MNGCNRRKGSVLMQDPASRRIPRSFPVLHPGFCCNVLRQKITRRDQERKEEEATSDEPRLPARAEGRKAHCCILMRVNPSWSDGKLDFASSYFLNLTHRFDARHFRHPCVLRIALDCHRASPSIKVSSNSNSQLTVFTRILSLGFSSTTRPRPHSPFHDVKQLSDVRRHTAAYSLTSSAKELGHNYRSFTRISPAPSTCRSPTPDK